MADLGRKELFLKLNNQSIANENGVGEDHIRLGGLPLRSHASFGLGLLWSLGLMSLPMILRFLL